MHGLEAKWSRFRPETELSLLNAAGGGRPVVVSAVTFALIARAVDAWRRTGGAFDPTGLDAIRAWGYDRDFAEVGDVGGRREWRPPIRSAGVRTSSWIRRCGR